MKGGGVGCVCSTGADRGEPVYAGVVQEDSLRDNRPQQLAGEVSSSDREPLPKRAAGFM
jgi:hypothetical protein